MRARANRRAGQIGAAAVMLGLALAGTPDRVARAQSTSSGSSAPEDLLYRLDILDAEIADIRGRLGGLSTGSGTASGGNAAAFEGEIRRLTAQVEKIQNTQRQIMAELNLRLGDLEFRLNELEGNPTAETVTPFPQTDDTVAGINVTPDQPEAPETSVSEQSDLDRAIDDVNQGRYDQAEDRLRRFISSYPGSPLIATAWFWLGESQSVRGDYAEAARSFLNGYRTDQVGQRASQNLYKLGVTLGQLGQINEACLTLREVRTRYPNAPDDIPSRADAEADRLSCG